MTILTEASTSRFADTPRWRMHYNEAGSGPAVIMLHGSGPGATGWSNFNSNIEALSQNYRVILLDFPGWGKSDEFDPDSGENRAASQVEAVRLLMDALGIEKAALVGNSMGGGACYAFAGRYPDRITHLVTMGAGLFGGVPMSIAPAGPSEGLRVLHQTYADPTPANFRRLCEIMLFDHRFVTDELIEQRTAAALANPRHLENWLRVSKSGGAMLPRDDAYQLAVTLGTSKVPALLVHGRDDRVAGVEVTQRAMAILPQSQMLVFNRCGHWAQVEHAPMFNALVDRFLATA